MARGVLGDDLDAAGFAVTGATVDMKSMAVRPRFMGVPTGAHPDPDGHWLPNRPMMIALIGRTWELRSRRWDPIGQSVADPDPDWVTSLRVRWPGTFDCEVSCCAGWCDLIEAVTVWLKERGDLVPFTQVKVKFGELRMYSDGALDPDGVFRRASVTPNDQRAHGDDLRVVRGDSPLGSAGIGDADRAHAGHFVGSDRHARASAADQYAAFELPAGDPLRQAHAMSG